MLDRKGNKEAKIFKEEVSSLIRKDRDKIEMLERDHLVGEESFSEERKEEESLPPFDLTLIVVLSFISAMNRG